MRNAYILVGKPEGRDQFQDLVVDGTIILEMYLEEIRWDGVGWMHVPGDGEQW
jgi:hypothetical protein